MVMGEALWEWLPLSIFLISSGLATSAGLCHRSGLISGTKQTKSPSTSGHLCSFSRALSIPPALANLQNDLPASGPCFSLAVEHLLAEQFQSSACSHLKTINKFHLQNKIVFKTVPLPLSLSIPCLPFPLLHSTLFQKLRFVFYLTACNWFCLTGGFLYGINQALSV